MGEVLKTGLIYSMDTTFCGYGTCNVIAINSSPASLYQFSVLIETLVLPSKKKKTKTCDWRLTVVLVVPGET